MSDTRPLPIIPIRPVNTLRTAASFSQPSSRPGRSRTNTTGGPQQAEDEDDTLLEQLVTSTTESFPLRTRCPSSNSQSDSILSYLPSLPEHAQDADLTLQYFPKTIKRAPKEGVSPLVVHQAILQATDAKEVKQFSASTPYWSRASVHGRLPAHGFRAHSSTVIGSALYLFGGCNKTQCFRLISLCMNLRLA